MVFGRRGENRNITENNRNERRKLEMKEFDHRKVKDPEYFRDGRLDAH